MVSGFKKKYFRWYLVFKKKYFRWYLVRQSTMVEPFQALTSELVTSRWGDEHLFIRRELTKLSSSVTYQHFVCTLWVEWKSSGTKTWQRISSWGQTGTSSPLRCPSSSRILTDLRPVVNKSRSLASSGIEKKIKFCMKIETTLLSIR